VRNKERQNIKTSKHRNIEKSERPELKTRKRNVEQQKSENAENYKVGTQYLETSENPKS
jgi:hypothetical protein